jgi:hypothetical protein
MANSPCRPTLRAIWKIESTRRSICSVLGLPSHKKHSLVTVLFSLKGQSR